MSSVTDFYNIEGNFAGTLEGTLTKDDAPFPGEYTVVHREAPNRIAKLTLIDRLQAAGKFELAMTAIKANALEYERWQASASVDSSNAQVIGLLQAIGGDLTTLLAEDN